MGHYGRLVDLPDQRDMIMTGLTTTNLPPMIDLRPVGAPVVDQGNLGSCVDNAVGRAVRFEEMKQNDPRGTDPSRLFLYYNVRVMEGTVDSDSGSSIRDGIKAAVRQGCCPESEWPYDIGRFTVKPSVQCYADALHTRAIGYRKLVRTDAQLRGCLASGRPFVYGFTVYESFEQIGVDGMMPMPRPDEAVLGGHAGLAMGYEDDTRRFICQNSWGAEWGDHGFYYMPYDFMLGMNASDFWVITLTMDQ